MIYDKARVKQLMMTTGDEILCEIIDEDQDDLIVRNVVRMAENVTEEGRYWIFRWYMTYQDDPERFLLIKSDKIVAVGNPLSALVNQYEVALEQMQGEDSQEIEDIYADEPEDDGSKPTKANVLKFPTIH